MTMQDQINKAFADIDAQTMADTLAWAEGRDEALTAYIKSDEEYCSYHAAMNICGSQKWYNVFSGRSLENIKIMTAKIVEDNIAKRNARIEKALTKKGITEIPEFANVSRGNGFEGSFKVGNYFVEINTIVAEGWIQSRHTRTLVKVREAA